MQIHIQFGSLIPVHFNEYFIKGKDALGEKHQFCYQWQQTFKKKGEIKKPSKRIIKHIHN